MRGLPPLPSLEAKSVSAVFEALQKGEVRRYAAEANIEYYHWEKLQYRPIPKGLTAVEAWHAVKWSRRSQYQALALSDVKDRPFVFWLPPHALATLHEVDRQGGSLAVSEGMEKTLGTMRDRVLVSSLMEEAIATSQIEGAATTREVAKEMLRTNRRPRDRSEQMIVSSYRTIQLLRERAQQPLSVGLLSEIQESMTRGTLDDPTGAGRLRTAEDNVEVVDNRDHRTVYIPPPAGQLEERMEKLIDFANAPPERGAFIHPLVKAAILHFWLAYEHPYIDGNGRTARALFYWHMLKSGYWLFEFLTISRIIYRARMQYYRSFLHSEHDENDLTYFLLLQLQATKLALEGLRNYIAGKQEKQRALGAALRMFPGLSPRQRDLIEEAMKHPDRVFTFQGHQARHKITYVTARADLLGLVKRELLAETRVGRQRAFLPASDLSEKLSGIEQEGEEEE